MKRLPLALRILSLAFVVGAPCGAQAVVSVRAARQDTLVASATATAAFMVTNAGADSIRERIHFRLPTDWTALAGMDSIALGPTSSEMLLVSVVVPVRTLAGIYTVGVAVGDASAGPSDSVFVRVADRVAAQVALRDRPGYVISGRGYATGFEVQNRGNRVATFQLRVRASVGSASLEDSVVRLEPHESRLVRARVRTPPGLNAAVDDVVEVLAHLEGAKDVEPWRASSRVTIVPEPSRQIEHFLRLPARMNLRAATSEGVAPVELFGRGLVRDGGSATLDFLFRGPTGTASAFGERDEYRAELRAPDWRVRGGDHVFSLSSLTAAGAPGFGVGVDGDFRSFSAGAYRQDFRRVPEGGSESGAFLGYRPMDETQLSLNHVDRSGETTGGRITSASLQAARFGFRTDVELARSASSAGTGAARGVRLSGATRGVSLDLGHQFADTSFSGSQRGAEHNYLSGSTPAYGVVSFGFNGSLHRTDLSRSTGVPYVERFRTGAISATLFDRVMLEAGNVARAATIASVRQSGEQWTLRGRADQDLGGNTFTLEVEGGASAYEGDRRGFSDVGLAARRSFPRGHGSVYAQRYSGGGLTKGADAAQTFGGDASVRIAQGTQATILGYATRRESAVSPWHSQLDALISRTVRGGGIVTLRARLFGGGSRTGSQQSVMYLEYGMPLRLPVSPLRTPGRVTGRVVDATSGRGVPGALVRLGPQVAITDRAGTVSFGGVPAGPHRLSMSQETSLANAVFVGDPTLIVDSTRRRPTTFALAIARSARVDVDVRRFVLARTAIDGKPDSLTDAGAVSNATVILASERDTLYRNTGENGRAVFTDIPPGTWSIAVRGDTPAFTRFAPDRQELVLAPGAVEKLTFRLIPRRREVQMIGDGQELRPTTAEPRTAPTQPPTRTGRPDEYRPNRQDHQ